MSFACAQQSSWLQKSSLVAFWIFLTTALGAIDLLTTFDIAVSVLFAILVFTAIYGPWRYAALVLAGLGSALTIVGYFASPPMDPNMPADLLISNRALTITLLWVSAALVVRYKAIETQLVQSRCRFDETFEQTAVGVAHIGLDGRWIRANSCFARILGYADTAELYATSLQQITHAGDLQAELSNASRLRQGDISTYSLEKRCLRKDGSIIWVNETVTLVRPVDGGDAGYFLCVMRDIGERKQAERALEESEQRARRQLAEIETLYHMAPIGLAMFSTDLRFIRVNERLAQINGLSVAEHIDRTPREVVPDLAVAAESLLRRVVETRQPILDVEFEGETARAPGEARIWREQLYPVLFDGSLEGVGVVVEDITEKKRAEQHLKLVMHELNHRVKNSLAVVQSIASQTVRASTSLVGFEEALIGRIRALADTHTLLTESNWRSAELREIVRQTLRPYRGSGNDSVAISGTDIALTPSASLAVSMVMHELTTNAMKYGALSSAPGKVRIEWRLVSGEGGEDLILRWSESGGPQVRSPLQSGFGSQLIEFTVRHEFGGTVKTDYRSDGLVCEIAIPWDKVALAARSGAVTGMPEPDPAARRGAFGS